MRKRIRALLLTGILAVAMIPSSAFAISSDPTTPGTEEKRETAILQNGEGGLTVQKEWADHLDHSEDEVTVQLYADGAAMQGKTLSLNAANDWRASFTGLPEYHDDGATPIDYTVKETAINGEPIDQLVKAGTYLEPTVEETQAAWEETDEVTEDRWVFASEGIQDAGEYVLIAPDNTNKTSDGLALNHQLGITRLTYHYEREPFTTTDGEMYNDYFSGVTEDTLWNTTAVAAPIGLFTLSNSTHRLTLSKTGDTYSFLLLDWATNNPGPGAIVLQTVITFPMNTSSGPVYCSGTYNGENYCRYMSIRDSSTSADGSQTTAGLTAVSNSEDASWVHFLKRVTYQGEKTIRHAAEITITNEETIPKKSMTVKKVWDDTEDHTNDDVTVQLLANGEPVQGQEILLNEENHWTYTFEELEPVDENGEEIVYFVKETGICGIPTEEAVAEGTFATPKIEVTKDSESSTITKEVEVEKEYWVPVTATNDSGAQVLEDGKTYAIVSCNWKNNNSHVALVANHADGTLETTPLEITYAEKTINGVTYDSYFNDLPQNCQWLVNVCYTDYNPNNEYNLYSFSNGDKKMALMGAYPNTYRFILTSKSGWVQEDMTNYQTMLQLQSKWDYGRLITIIAGRIEGPNFYKDMWMYLQDGTRPAEHCTNQFAACVKFYEKVTVTEKEEQQIVVDTPSEVTITNKTLPPGTTPTDGDGDGNPPTLITTSDTPVNTGDTSRVLLWILLFIAAAGTLTEMILYKRKEQ